MTRSSQDAQEVQDDWKHMFVVERRRIQVKQCPFAAMLEQEATSPTTAPSSKQALGLRPELELELGLGPGRKQKSEST
ncbi:hypothetical protein AWZ03_003968 [Drosophila navojoa]|uniref:Uncharacterized protein n=1 Tax=Drosophila navojoa TaxID=7232 RepID=A0A484BNV2_DRONA|nr:hypothetical protein AWZ03_003968 [Drosophila navojoa]